MKKILAILLAAVLTVPVLAAAEERSIVDVLREDKTTQAFTDDPVDEDDLTKIVEAGVNAPSAMNSQPWHFTVVTNADVLAQMNGDMPAAATPKACGWMNAAARALGYGTKVVAAARNTINASAELKATLGIPEDMDVAAILLIGTTDDSIDGATGATERSAFDDVVTIVK